MKQDKQDRRSQRTRHLVISAMMELLREKRYSTITVQDLLDRSDIGRSTFYTHYFDKEDVLASVVEEQLKLLSQQLSDSNAERSLVPSLEMFRHVQENHQFFQAMIRGHAGEELWETGRVLLSKYIEQTLTLACKGKGPTTVPLTVVSQYLTGAFANLLKWWLDSDMPYTPEQMDNLFRQLTLTGVWATVEGTSE